MRRLPPSLGAVVARGASILASLVLTIVVARTLPVEAAGSFFVVYTAGIVGATFGRFGVDNYAIKRLGSAGDHRAELRHGWQLVALASAVGAVAFGLVLTVLKVHGLGGPGVLWAALTVPPQALVVVAGAVLRGRGRLVWGIIAELGSVPALASIVILGGAVTSRLSLDGAVGALAVAATLSAAWSVPMAIAATSTHDSATPLALPVAGLLDFVRRRGAALSSMMGASVLYYLVAWAPVFALTIVGRFVEVALVTVAARLANFVTLVPSIQVSYLAPKFSQHYHSGHVADLNRLARASSRRAILVVAVPAVVLAAGASQLLRVLYGAEFEAAAPLLSVLVVGALAAVGLGQVSQLMLICDLERWALILSVVFVAVWATAGLWLARAHGAGAVVILAALGSVVYSVAGSVLLLRKRGVRSFA